MRSKILKAVGILFVLLILLIVGALAFTQTDYFKSALKGVIERTVSSATGQKFGVGEIQGDFLRGFRINNVSLRVEGKPFVYVEEFLIKYPILLDAVFSKVISVDDVLLKGLNVRLIRYEDGSWNFNKLGGEKETEEEEEKEEEEGEEKASPEWDILIGDLLLQNAEIIVENRNTGKVTTVRIPDFDSSLNLYDITRKVEFNLDNADIFVAPNEIKINGLTTEVVYSATEEQARIENFKANLNGAEVTLKAEVENFKNPEFQFQASAYGYKIEQGVLNAEVEGGGKYVSPENIQALVKVRMPDSKIGGRSVSGSVGQIRMTGTEIKVDDGIISSDFGKVLFGGTADLERILAKEGANTLDFNLALQNVDVTEVLDILKKKIENQPEIPNAILNARFDVEGKWQTPDDFNVRVNVEEFHQEGKAGDIDLTGIVEATKSNVEFDIRSTLDRVNLGLILNEERYVSNLNSNLQAEGSVPLGGNVLDNLTTSVRGEILPSSFSGVDIREGKVIASYDEETLNVESFSLISDKFRLKAEGTAEKGEEVDVTFDAEAEDLSFISKILPDLDLEGSLDAEGRVRGEIENPQITLSANASDFRYGGTIQVESAKLDGSGVVDLESLELSLDATLRGIQLQGRDIQKVDLQARDAGKGIRADISILEDAERSYRVELKLVDLASREKNLQVENLTLNLEKATLHNRRPINVTILPNGIAVDSFNLYSGGTSLLADADVNFEGDIDADLNLNRLNLTNVSQLLDLESPVRGVVSGTANLEGSVVRPRISASLNAQGLQFKEFQSDTASLSLAYSDRDLDLSLNVTESGREILSAGGGADVNLNLKRLGENLKKADFDVTIRSNGFELTPVAKLTGKEISGVVSGDIGFQGTLQNPTVRTNIIAQNLGFRGFESDRLTLNLSYLNRELDVNLNATQNGREILSVTGGANVNLSLTQVRESVQGATFDLRIQSSGFDLGALAGISEGVKEIGGEVFIDLRASGNFEDLQLNGRLRLENAVLQVEPLREPITVATGLLEFQGQKAFLRTLEIKTDDGGGVFQGQADLEAFSYQLSGRLDDFEIELEQVTAKMDGNLDAEGSDGRVKLTGDIKVERGRVRIPEERTKEVEEIKFVDERQEGEEEFTIETAEEEGYFEKNVAMNLEVEIPRNVWVRGKGANIELEGDVRIIKEFGEELVLVGNINTLRGYYEIFGKLFEIQEGTVSFQGTPEINPFLDITALYEVSGVDIFVNIDGTVEKPELKLTSDPSLQETDIFSYLVFGTSSDKIGAGERVSLEASAAQVLGNLAAGQLNQLVGDQLSLDVIRIRAAKGGPQVEVGKYLTDELYIAYERGPAETLTTATPVVTNQVRVEYSPFDFLTLESEIGGEQAGGDVFFTFEYSCPFLE